MIKSSDLAVGQTIYVVSHQDLYTGVVFTIETNFITANFKNDGHEYRWFRFSGNAWISANLNGYHVRHLYTDSEEAFHKLREGFK
tara:strand:- start:411 stop:665 length:255 start_codon:yes stop_codon:yes gene_type:complete